MINNLPGVEIKCKKHPIMSFEIFGEYAQRSSALKEIKHLIESLEKMLKSRSTRVYNQRIHIHELNSLGSVLKEVKRFQEKYSSMSITVKFDGTGDDNVLPVVHIISDDTRVGKEAREEIEKVFKMFSVAGAVSLTFFFTFLFMLKMQF